MDLEAEYPVAVATLTGGEYKRQSGGLTFRCPIPERHRNGDRNPSCRLFVSRTGGLVCKCFGCGADWRELCRAVGLPPRELVRPDQRHGGGPQAVSKTVARYSYMHPDGSPYGTKLRLEPKSFLWERPLPADLRALCGISAERVAVVCGARAMEQGWYKGKPDAKGVVRFRQCEPATEGAVIIPAAGPCPLFLGESIGGPNHDRPVAVCEGEKDALTAWKLLGAVAVCGPHGANHWTPEYARQLAGRRVVLVPHHDGPGLAFMERVAGSLLSNGCAEIRTLWPWARGWELAEGEDLTDWATRQGADARAKFARVVERLPAWRCGA